MGTTTVTPGRPAYYARTGTSRGDLLAILHPPYTAWHLAFATLGAAVAGSPEPLRLAGTLTALFLGTGIGAHALDERHGRPLGTTLRDTTLAVLGVCGLGSAVAIGVVGAATISPWLLVWVLFGALLAPAYVLEWSPLVHSDLGFALAWGAFPVLLGYWAQAESLSVPAIVLAVAAALFSLAQRSLSTPARLIRRRASHLVVSFDDGDHETRWDQAKLLATWERPLSLLAAAMVALALALLLAAR